MGEIITITKDGRDPCEYSAYYPNHEYGELRAFIIHEDALLSLVGIEAMEKLEEGDEVKFRLVEVKG